MADIKEQKIKKSPKNAINMIAKKAFVICHNDYFRNICVGDDLSDVPEKFHENMRTELVLTTKEGES